MSARMVLPLLLVASCNATPEAYTQTTTVAVSQAPEVAESASVPAPSSRPPDGAEPLPPALLGPKAVACKLETTALFAQHAWKLRLAPGGPEGLVVNGGIPATLLLPRGDALVGAFLEASDPRATVRGWLNTGDVRLSAARPLTLGGYYMPYSWTPLSWLPRNDASQTVRVAAPGDDSVQSAAPPSADVDCTHVTIGAAIHFDPHKALPHPTGNQYGKLAAAEVTLSVTATSAGVAVIKKKGAGVWVHERKSGKTRITLPSSGGLVFGWVDAADVTATTDAVGGIGHGVSWATGGGRGLPFAEYRSCTDELPVVLELGSERATIGHFGAGEVIQVTRGRLSKAAPPPLGPLRQVRLKGRRWFTVASGAELLARTADVAACSPSPR